MRARSSIRSSERGSCTLGAVMLLCAAGFADVAWAEEPEAKALAKELFDRAQLDYKLGRFHEALDGYSKAYEVLPLPEFLFNIAQCHRYLENFERAVFFYEGFIRESRDPERLQLAARLLEQSRRLRDEQQPAVDEAAPLAEAPPIETATRARDRSVELAPRPPPPAPLEAPPVEEPVPVYERAWFWSVIGGAAAVIAGVSIAVAVTVPSDLPSGSLGTGDHR